MMVRASDRAVYTFRALLVIQPWLSILRQNISAETTVPSVISVSYGEDEKSVGFDYATRCNSE